MKFKISDPLVGFCAGGIIAFLVYQAVPSHWNMFAGMILGGVMGMILKFVFMIGLIPFFGAFETMIPLSIIGMTVGMTGGMAAAYGDLPLSCTTAAGAMIGLLIAVMIQISNRRYQKIHE